MILRANPAKWTPVKKDGSKATVAPLALELAVWSDDEGRWYGSIELGGGVYIPANGPDDGYATAEEAQRATEAELIRRVMLLSGVLKGLVTP